MDFYEKHPKMKYLFVGCDTHKLTHTASIINVFNEKLATLTFNNDKAGYNSLYKMVGKHTAETGLTAVYGLEDTKHLGYGLASFLLNKGCIVKNVNSNLTHVERKKFPTITKNDELDSLCIAKVLLDELDTLPNAESDEIYWTLKQLIKMRRAIVHNNVEYKNKLHSQLLHHYSNYHQMFYRVDGVTALEMWETYPSPNMILDSGIDTFTAFILKASRGKLGASKAGQIFELIKEYDVHNRIYQEERNCIIQMLVRSIKENDKRLADIDKEVIAVYDRIGKTLHTFPGLNKISGAQILAEIGNINRFANNSKLARYSGIAPVDCSSGNSEKAFKSDFGNRELNGLIYNLACRSLTAGKNKDKPNYPIFLEYYYRKRNDGKTKHQSIICIMRRIINIIFFMLKHDKEYFSPAELEEKSLLAFQERQRQEQEKQKKKERHQKRTG